jgi:hypothetical protein
MKNIKLISLVWALVVIVGFSSCDRDLEPGGVAVEEMCGEWVAYVPDYDLTFHLKTSNTANNESNTLLLTDRSASGTGAAGFWEFTVRTTCDLGAKTFSCTDVTNEYWTEVNGVYQPYDIKISVRNGKITENAVELPSGTTADKIELEISFSDDEPGTYYKIVGYRYSGFFEDDNFVYTGE